MPEVDDGLIPLSALQHHLFCPRQCALIHVEQIWAEDTATAEGRLLHQRVDAGGGDTRLGTRVERGVALRSAALGVSGRADAVEFHGRPPRPFPVEYKRGKPKPHRADEVQLCAQAICLEEMSGCAVPEGSLFDLMEELRPILADRVALSLITSARLARPDRSAWRKPTCGSSPWHQHGRRRHTGSDRGARRRGDGHRQSAECRVEANRYAPPGRAVASRRTLWWKGQVASA